MNKLNTKVILVHVDFSGDKVAHEDLQEFQELAHSAGAEVLDIITCKRLAPDAKYYLGKGKAEEIALLVLNSAIELVIFNHELSPSQERNLERLFNCRVLDRTGLILDIFAQRARSFEGRLQVELAQLQHLSTRLVRGWSHLERQRGGIGLRGPGETQLEVDRRLLRNRIKMIKKRLEKVRSQRQLGRRARRRAEIPTISLVGYTNVGKSTLFNKLTAATVETADKLFATLDPTLRRIDVPDVGTVILADTVGFVRHLPHALVDAFHATLEETREADLLLHVIDAHDPERREKIAAVNNVLAEIDAEQLPQLLVFNKIDLTPNSKATLNYDPEQKPKSVKISAVTGEGIELLWQALTKLLAGKITEQTIKLSPQQGELRAKLYQQGAVIAEEIDKEGNWILKIKRKKGVKS